MNRIITSFGGSAAQVSRRWNSSGTVSILPTGGRFGGPCIHLSQGASLSHAVPSTGDYHAGFAFRLDSDWNFSTGAANNIMGTQDAIDGPSGGVGLRISSTGAPWIVPGAFGSTQWVGTPRFQREVWYFIEHSVLMDYTSGTLAAYISGSSTPDSPVVTGRTGTPGSNIELLYFYASGGGMRIADVYFNDSDNTDGAGNTSRWGEMKAICLKPTSDSVISLDLTPSTGTDHYTLVSDGDAATDVSGASGTDQFGFGNLGFTAKDILGAQLVVDAYKGDADNLTVAGVAYDGSITDTKDAQALSTSIATYEFGFPKAPDGGDWDQATLEATEFGVTIAS